MNTLPNSDGRDENGLSEANFFRIMAELSRITAAAWGLDRPHEQLELGLEAAAGVVTYPIIDPDNRPAPGERGDSPKAKARSAVADRLLKQALRRGHLHKIPLALNVMRCEACNASGLLLVEPLDLWCWECKECGAVQRGAQQAQASQEILESAAPSMSDVLLHQALEENPEKSVCVVCRRGHESGEFKGTCDACGAPTQLGAADMHIWLQAPERNMRCRQCGDKSTGLSHLNGLVIHS